jgi:hypothetical protein
LQSGFFAVLSYGDCGAGAMLDPALKFLHLAGSDFCFMQLKFADAGKTYEAYGINICAFRLRQVRR